MTEVPDDFSYIEYAALFKKNVAMNFLTTLPMRKTLEEIAGRYQVSMADVIRTCLTRAAPEIYPKWNEVYSKHIREAMEEVISREEK